MEQKKVIPLYSQQKSRREYLCDRLMNQFVDCGDNSIRYNLTTNKVEVNGESAQWYKLVVMFDVEYDIIFRNQTECKEIVSYLASKSQFRENNFNWRNHKKKS